MTKVYSICHTCDDTDTDATVFIREIELWNDMRYLSDIKSLLGSVLHHKVHSYTQFFQSFSQDIQQHHIIAFATSLPASLLKSETILEIINVK